MYFLVLGIQSMTLVFPFSQGLSISRRAFYLGTLGLFSLIAVGMTVLYMLGGVIERATNGWGGVDGYFFNIPWVTDGPWYSTAAFFFVLMMFMFIIGFWFATIFKRWGGTTGTLVSTLGTTVALVGAAALTTFLQGWGGHVGGWFAQQTPLSISGWAALLCVILAAGSYTTLRRATPIGSNVALATMQDGRAAPPPRKSARAAFSTCNLVQWHWTLRRSTLKQPTASGGRRVR